ncbi:MAG: TonB-dependent receptor plug domain-containing protein, partial [Sandaracinaceae bacterium]
MRRIAWLIALASLSASPVFAQSDADAGVEAPETEAPETDAPETDAGEAEAPETDAAEAEAPETGAAEAETPETDAAEAESPEEDPEEPAAETGAGAGDEPGPDPDAAEPDASDDDALLSDDDALLSDDDLFPEGGDITDIVESEEDLAIPEVVVEAEAIEDEPPPDTGGSVHRVDEAQLERFNYDNPEAVLQQVPGAYLRFEGGGGLRAKIGVRGVSSERSSRVTLMEDGV